MDDGASSDHHVYGRAKNRPRASSVLNERPLLAPPKAALPPVPTQYAPSSSQGEVGIDEGSAGRTGGGSFPKQTGGRRKSESSKASLTEALSKAQVAVQMDMSGDVQGAVDAYTTSVELLQQVMARVEAGSAKDAARILPQDLAPEKREKIQRRQQARLDESQRLKVIHDTYLERITILMEGSVQAPQLPDHDYERHPFAYDSSSPQQQQYTRRRQPSVASSLTPDDPTPTAPGNFSTSPESTTQQRATNSRQSFMSSASTTAPATVTRFPSDASYSRQSQQKEQQQQQQTSPRTGSRFYTHERHHSSSNLVNATTTSGTIYQRRQPPSSDTSGGSASGSPRQGRHRQAHSVSSFSSQRSQRSSIEGLPISNESPIRESHQTASAAAHLRSGASTPTASSHPSVSGSPQRQHNHHYQPSTSSSFSTQRTSVAQPSGSTDGSPPPPTPVEKEGLPAMKSVRPRSLSQPGRKLSLADGTLPQMPQIPAPYRQQQQQQTQQPSPPVLASVSPPKMPSVIDMDSPGTATDLSFSAQHPQSRPPSLVPVPGGAIAPSLPPLNRALFQPVAPLRRPFQLLQRIHESITSGAYLTQRLFAPKTIWAQAGIKLASLDTKQRMVDMLLMGLEGVDRVGQPLVVAQATGEHAKYGRATAERLAKELDAFESVLESIESGPAKKLSLTEGPGVKKGGWLPKMARGFDKMTNSKGNDAPQSYVDALHRLCDAAQALDRHLMLVAGGESSAYADLPAPLRSAISAKLQRASEFFSTVVCRWVLGDVAVLLDKHVKRSGAYAVE